MNMKLSSTVLSPDLVSSLSVKAFLSDMIYGHVADKQLAWLMMYGDACGYTTPDLLVVLMSLLKAMPTDLTCPDMLSHVLRGYCTSRCRWSVVKLLNGSWMNAVEPEGESRAKSSITFHVLILKGRGRKILLQQTKKIKPFESFIHTKHCWKFFIVA